MSRIIRSDAASEFPSKSHATPFSSAARNPARAKFEPISRHCKRMRSLRAAFRRVQKREIVADVLRNEFAKRGSREVRPQRGSDKMLIGP